MGKYVVEHNILEIDRNVFASGKSDKFFHPDKWPSWIKESLEIGDTPLLEL